MATDPKNTFPQPAQQEPVQLAATITITQRGSTRTIDNHFEDCVRDWPDGEYKLYTSPPTLSLAQRQARSADTWVGLTDEEIDVAWNNCEAPYGFAEDIEAKLKEKNT